jgi:hypothetical protein
MVFNATFNNISVRFSQSVLLMEETMKFDVDDIENYFFDIMVHLICVFPLSSQNVKLSYVFTNYNSPVSGQGHIYSLNKQYFS